LTRETTAYRGVRTLVSGFNGARRRTGALPAEGDYDAHLSPQGRRARPRVMRFSASSNTIDAGDFERLVGGLEPREPVLVEQILAHGRVGSVEARQAVHGLE